MERATTESSAQVADGRGRSIGKWIILAIALALAGTIGVKIRTALTKKAQIAAEAKEQAQKAGRGAVAKPTELIRGVSESWTPTFRLDGTLNPLRAVDLAFKAGGRLGRIAVARGDRVQQGALLAALDSAEARAQVDAAEAQVKAAEAQLALARDAEERMVKIASKGVASEQSLVQSRAQVALAAAQLEGARAQAKLASVNADNHTLAAPFRGLVVRAPNAPGAVVAPGIPMFRIEDTTTLQLDGTLAPEEAALVAVGSPVEIEVDGRSAQAKLSLVLGALDQGTRRVQVAAQLDNDGKSPVRPGAFVRARVTGLTPVDVVRLPSSALRPGSQDVVLVAVDGVVRERRVVFSLSPEGDLLVRRGLGADEQVVRSPTAEMRSGDPVITTLETK